MQEYDIMVMTTGMYSSNTDQWATPIDFFNRLNSEFHFTLDVCADDTNYKCDKYYTKSDDGLSKIWNGICWMNPPYGREIEKWMKKAYQSALSGCVCVCLVPARTDTKWWHDYAMKSSEIRLVKGRLKFGDSKNSAPFPSAVVVFTSKSNSPILTSM